MHRCPDRADYRGALTLSDAFNAHIGVGRDSVVTYSHDRLTRDDRQNLFRFMGMDSNGSPEAERIVGAITMIHNEHQYLRASGV